MSRIQISGDEIIKESSNGIKLSDGAYPAVIVGVYISLKEAFKEGDDPFKAIRFALQLTDDDGNVKVQQTNDMRLSLSEKSTLFKQLSSWCKSASPKELWEKLRPLGIVSDKNIFEYEKFIGKHVQLMVTMKQSKKDATQFFPELQFSAPKKGQTFEAVTEKDKLVPIWKPKFVNAEDEIDCICMDGFEWKRYEKNEEGSNNSDRPTRDSLETQVPAQSGKSTGPKNQQKTATVPSKGESDTDLPF